MIDLATLADATRGMPARAADPTPPVRQAPERHPIATGRMYPMAFDTETGAIRPGLIAPRLVCGSIAHVDGTSARGHLLTANDARTAFRNWLDMPAVCLVGANLAYDLAVMARDAAESGEDLMPRIFKALDEGRAYDVLIGQALDAIAHGQLMKDQRTGGPLLDSKGRHAKRYSLDACVWLALGRRDAKVNDAWRVRYAILAEVPIGEWPEEARRYPVDDAVNTLEVAIAQVYGVPQPHVWTGAGTCDRCGCPADADDVPCKRGAPYRNLRNMTDQVRAAFALQLGAAWGIRTDRARVDALEAEAADKRARAMAKHRAFFKSVKVTDAHPDGMAKDVTRIKRAIALAYGARVDAPCTCDGGKVPSAKTGNPVICDACDGTGLHLPPSVPRTDGGAISKSRDTLMESGDEDLADFAEVDEDKIARTYIPFLRKGVDWPIALSANVIVASGRVSYDDVIQLLPKKGGVRECFVARPGYVLCSTDYAAAELCSLAQVLLWTVGHSVMADVIRETKDPGALHTRFGARLAGVAVEDFAARVSSGDKRAKSYRQAAKALNFGLPGGMGAATFTLAKRKKIEGDTVGPDGRTYAGLRFCILIDGAPTCGIEKVTEWRGRECPPVCRRCVETVERLKAEWLEMFPEVRHYFKWVSTRVDASGELEQFLDERVRGGLSFPDGCNTLFQGLTARGAKRGLWYVSREAYTDRSSPLYGTRPIAFAHDDVISEMPETLAHLAAPRQAELMIKAMQEATPDIPTRCEPALMRAWRSGVDAVYRDGKLIPWEDRDDA